MFTTEEGIIIKSVACSRDFGEEVMAKNKGKGSKGSKGSQKRRTRMRMRRVLQICLRWATMRDTEGKGRLGFPVVALTVTTFSGPPRVSGSLTLSSDSLGQTQTQDECFTLPRLHYRAWLIYIIFQGQLHPNRSCSCSC